MIDGLLPGLLVAAATPDFLRPAIVDQTLEMYRASGGHDLIEVSEPVRSH